jgi:hypothetical protein
MKLLELKWGCLIGLVGVIWLYGSYFMGLHSDGIGKIQLMVGLGFLISFISYGLAMSAIVKAQPETSFVEGLKSGGIMAVIAAVIAVVAQFGYFQWINPDWTRYMMDQTRIHFEAAGTSSELIEEQVKWAEMNFSLKTYAMQAGLGALLSGFIFSAFAMGMIRFFKNR